MSKKYSIGNGHVYRAEWLITIQTKPATGVHGNETSGSPNVFLTDTLEH